MEQVNPHGVGIPLLYYTVSDAVASLTRKRIRKNGPFLLKRPRSPLIIEQAAQGFEDNPSQIKVTCATWDGTVLILPLASQSDRRNWLAWGDIQIHYATHHSEPALTGTSVQRTIGPSFAYGADGPMRYDIRKPVKR